MQLLPGHQLFEQIESALARFRHVEMRVGAVDRHRVAVFQHRLGQVDVQVEADHDRHVGTDDGTHPAQEFPLAVLVVFADHRAVEVEVHPVELSGRFNPAADKFGDALGGIARDETAGLGRTPAQWQQVVTRRLRPGQVAAERDIEAAHGVEQRFAAGQRGPAVGALEGMEISAVRREGIGFVLKAADGNLSGSGHASSRRKNSKGKLTAEK